ncbi:MAG: TRAP transporter small permease [Clostridiaceae bacterium]|nr:TRAP transporter small permease [Clostridiaceae bacterium]
MDGIQKIRDLLDRILGTVTVCLFALMTIVGTYQIMTRYFFNRPSTVSEELLTYSFTWMSLLAAAYVFGKRDHMRMAFLADKISGKKRVWLEIGIEILIFLFAGVVMLYGGIQITRLTMSQITASLQIPMGYVYLVIPLSGGLIMIYNAMNIAEMIGKKEVE